MWRCSLRFRGFIASPFCVRFMKSLTNTVFTLGSNGSRGMAVVAVVEEGMMEAEGTTRQVVVVVVVRGGECRR